MALASILLGYSTKWLEFIDRRFTMIFITTSLKLKFTQLGKAIGEVLTMSFSILDAADMGSIYMEGLIGWFLMLIEMS